MPSTLPLPTISSLVQAASNAVMGEDDPYADVRSGSLYNHAVGPTAVLFSREADRDKSLFEDIYFDNASGKALTRYVWARDGIARVMDSAGAGTCSFTRPTAGGGAGPFLKGTRIQVAGTPPMVYEVSADTTVGAGALTATIPIDASVLGTGVKIAVSSGLSLLDEVYDLTWKPISLSCADGTDFEEASAFRARVTQTKLNERTGYLPQLTLACQSVGAKYVVAFSSQYGLPVSDFLDDFGLNAVYVADAGYQTTPALVLACQNVLESWRVLGADLWVGGMANVPLTLNFLVALVDNPTNLPQQSIRRLCAQALLAAFGPTDGGFSYSAQSLASAVNNASPYVQHASVPALWVAETDYSLGDLVYAGGALQKCVESGESGVGLPSFSSKAGVVTFDGSASWLCLPHQDIGIYAGGVLQLADPVLYPSLWPATLPRYTLAMNNINFTFTGPL